MCASKIYIVAPANVYTGGPTALFQLCHTLNKYFDVNAVMVFTSLTEGLDPVHPNYRKYNCRWLPISKVEDSPRNLLILPETQPSLLRRFKTLRKVIYWLSVDNFFHSLRKLRALFFRDALLYSLRYGWPHYEGLQNDVMHYIASKEALNAVNNPSKILRLIEKVELHIAQSLYSRNFLVKLGVDKDKVLIVREPLEEEFLNANISFENRRDIVAFNARKAFSIVYKALSKMMQQNSNIKIIPLANVGKEGMLRILSNSKVFVDIGLHPGRDRPFREAGLLGNVVIVNRSGGCYYFEDCPIPDAYTIKCRSIACRDLSVNRLINLIIDCIDNYEHHVANFQKLREYLISEHELYLKDLNKLLNNVLK